ncbi:MAG: pyruvate dehydrogenase (acetyl-transferring), homodimeric type [Sorangiineae bacterium NIC37A_2]|nr:MAG: pyruvate dehydrogenase (acetyl-transferring), homodimeric type [Sorangiineae bacterium NIC37A_2]
MSIQIPEATDRDPQETREWIESLDAVIEHEGAERARFILRRVLDFARLNRVEPKGPLVTDYVNTITPEEEPAYPGDPELEARVQALVRWNAMAMVQRGNKRFDGLGGHLSSYASSATMYEVGFNHFFRGPEGDGAGDLVFYQGHASPGIYARSFVEGRLSVDQVDRFRRETVRGAGISSYPHPRLMPSYWQFPTVSMGIGPITAIYQARFARYLSNRGIKNTEGSHVWAFLGDGECDEPESLGQLSIAAREKLDNLTFVVNCNLQRLDGPVRGNGKIVQELEGIFRGAGWEVIKVLWAPEWDPIFARDTDGLLRRYLNATVDGQWQRYINAPGDFVRKDLFGRDPRLLELVSDLSDEQIASLRRGGHSYEKVYAAYARAQELRGQGRPVAILCHTVKGWSLGEGFEGVNTTHQKKTLTEEELCHFRDRLGIPLDDAAAKQAQFYHPGKDSPEVQYMLERRRALGGLIPTRRTSIQVPLELPDHGVYAEFEAGMAKGEASTTMVFSRLLAKLVRDKKIGKRIVPIIPDEARTFGLDALFGNIGIYSPEGQLYEPKDKGKLMYYKEAKDGQVLEEGITEAGSLASFTAAATSYSVFNEPMIPFYIFYSMFGFQRVGDQIWAASDSMSRGFLLGATAGRTTLNGEGLQHEDGHSLLNSLAFSQVKSYDPAFAYELAVIIEDGMRRMYVEEENIFYYITVYNEDFRMPPMPGHAAWAEAEGKQADPALSEKVREGIIRGIYQYSAVTPEKLHVELLGSGPLLFRAIEAREILKKYGVSANIWSVTSYHELRNDALSADRWNRLHPLSEGRVPFLKQALDGVTGPFIAVSDYMKALPDLVREWLPGPLTSLGTEGFGMSDTREELRRHFEIDAESIAIAALDALRKQGKVDGGLVARAISELGVNPDKLDPLSV